MSDLMTDHGSQHVHIIHIVEITAVVAAVEVTRHVQHAGVHSHVSTGQAKRIRRIRCNDVVLPVEIIGVPLISRILLFEFRLQLNRGSFKTRTDFADGLGQLLGVACALTAPGA